MKGRNTVMVGIRISDEEYGVLLEIAEKKGVSVSALIKGKVQGYIQRINEATKEPINKPIRKI